MRVTPETFWTMSLAEWRAAVAGFTGGVRPHGPALDGRDLAALMRRYPDGRC
jgi:uncharacterized phage protein (TIGR02216 family)